MSNQVRLHIKHGLLRLLKQLGLAPYRHLEFAKSKIHEQKIEIKRRTKENTKLEEDTKQLTKENTKLEEDTKRRTKENIKLEEDTKQLTKENTKLEEDTKQLTKKNTKLKADTKQLKKENSNLRVAFTLSSTMSHLHLTEIKEISTATKLFKDSIEMVEVEVFSYCNRVCWFCPNSKYERRNENNYLDEKIYLHLLTQLGECGFDKKISFSRYNEPLSDRIIIKRIEQAREIVPLATLHLNTNGDYLNRLYLDELYDAGLRSMNIQVYLNNDEDYNHDKVTEKMKKQISDLNLPAEIRIDRVGFRLEAVLNYKDMFLRIYGRNFEKSGCDRGGTVEINRDMHFRESPCLSPFHHIYIDYNGSIMPCCNLRSDIPTHSDCVIGKIDEKTSIFLTYTNATAAAWRRSLVGFEEKEGVCKHCKFNEFPNTLETRKSQSNLLEFSKLVDS